jgi:hypothetical protein
MTTKMGSAKMMTMRQKRERLLFLAKLGEESYLTKKEGKEYDDLRKLFD